MIVHVFHPWSTSEFPVRNKYLLFVVLAGKSKTSFLFKFCAALKHYSWEYRSSESSLLTLYNDCTLLEFGYCKLYMVVCCRTVHFTTNNQQHMQTNRQTWKETYDGWKKASIPLILRQCMDVNNLLPMRSQHSVLRPASDSAATQTSATRLPGATKRVILVWMYAPSC